MPPARKPARSLAPPEEVAEYLDIPAATLKDWRHKGTGPAYTRQGRHVRYDWADVDAWVKAKHVEPGKSASGGKSAA